MPLIRRLPKRGFSNAAFRKKIAEVNLDNLRVFGEGETVNESTLREKRVIKGRYDLIKILARGEAAKGLAVEVDLISDAAREKIEKAGGTVTLRTAASVASGDDKGATDTAA